MRRKLAKAESTAIACQQEKETLVWTVKEKELLIEKIETEITQAREECSSKAYTYQKEVKGLEEKCRRFKEEVEKQKARR